MTCLGGRRVTIWNTFKALYPRATSVEGLPTGTSQPLTAAWVEMITAYTNNIAENFESRVLRYHLQSKIIDMDPQYVSEIATKYCYPTTKDTFAN